MLKKAMSHVVASILIILVVVVAVFLIWMFVLPIIGDGFGEQEGGLSVVTSEGYTVYDESNGFASVQIRRGDDVSELNSIDVIFSVEGESVKFVIPEGDVLEKNSVRMYKFNLSGSEPDSVRVVPAFGIGVGSVSGKVVAGGNVIWDAKFKVGSVDEEGMYYGLDESGVTVSFSFGGADVGVEPEPVVSCFDSSVSPIPICTCEDLQMMNGYLSFDFELNNSVDCLGFDFESIGYSDGEYWNDDHGDAFTGTFNGDEYVISNLEIISSDFGVGLFAYTSGATISRVGLENVNVYGGSAVGALVGYALDGTHIEQVYSSGEVYSNEFYAGGLVGVLSGSDIYDSYSRANVGGDSDDVGGLVGYMEQATCANLVNTYATGDVIGSNKVGGLVGETYSDCEIRNSFAMGDVTMTSTYEWRTDMAGGLIGLYGQNTQANSPYAQYPATTVSNSYWYIGSSDSCAGDNPVDDCYPVVSKGELHSSNYPVYSEWDFVNVWTESGSDYPRLAWEEDNWVVNVTRLPTVKNEAENITTIGLKIISSENVLAIKETFIPEDCEILDTHSEPEIDVFEINEAEQTWIMADSTGALGVDMYYSLPFNCGVDETAGKFFVLTNDDQITSGSFD